MADLSSHYIQKIGVLWPNLAVSSKSPSGDFIDSQGSVFRSITAFVNQIKEFNRCYSDKVKAYWITHACLQGVAYK